MGTSAKVLVVGNIFMNVLFILVPDKRNSGGTNQSTADMTAFVQSLLEQMQARFNTMSETIVSKIDEMGSRINELEESMNDLRTEMGQEGSPSPLSLKQKPDEAILEEGTTTVS